MWLLYYCSAINETATRSITNICAVVHGDESRGHATLNTGDRIEADGVVDNFRTQERVYAESGVAEFAVLWICTLSSSAPGHEFWGGFAVATCEHAVKSPTSDVSS